VTGPLFRPIQIYCCSAPEDEKWRKRLMTHLAEPLRQGELTIYDDPLAGSEREQEITDQIDQANMILLLLSPDLLASNDLYKEVRRALQRQQSGAAVVLPILLRPVELTGTAFSHLQMLPTNRQPVSTWDDKDEAFQHIVQEIRKRIASRQWPISSDVALPTNTPRQTPMRLSAHQQKSGLVSGLVFGLASALFLLFAHSLWWGVQASPLVFVVLGLLGMGAGFLPSRTDRSLRSSVIAGSIVGQCNFFTFFLTLLLSTLINLPTLLKQNWGIIIFWVLWLSLAYFVFFAVFPFLVSMVGGVVGRALSQRFPTT
jgi:F0F1-type ATP synthase assembly protein I